MRFAGCASFTRVADVVLDADSARAGTCGKSDADGGSRGGAVRSSAYGSDEDFRSSSCRFLLGLAGWVGA